MLGSLILKNLGEDMTKYQYLNDTTIVNKTE